jgi:hypothetical protein
VPEHGEFNPESKQWYCSYWMSRELWIDIHDYSPPSTGEGSAGLHDAGDQVSTHTMHVDTEEESITKAKKHGIEVQGCADESLNQEMSKNNDQ